MKYFLISLFLFFFIASKAQNFSEFLDQGIKYMSKQDSEKALESFEKAYRLKSSDPNVLAFRGQAKHNLNRFEDAIQDYNKALEIQPNYAEVFHLRGLAKYELKNVIGACEDWEKANQIGYSGVIDLIIEFCLEKSK